MFFEKLKNSTAKNHILVFIILSGFYFGIIPTLSCLAEIGLEIKPDQIPNHGKNIKDFVPQGWILSDSVQGELNPDGVKGAVLMLIEIGAPKSPESRPIIVVLKKQIDGKWQKIAIANRILLCHLCGGMFFQPPKKTIPVKLEKGVIIIDQISGSRGVFQSLHRFWFDQKLNQVVLIGEDIQIRDRATGDSNKQSINYLTGEKITEKYRNNRKLGATGVLETKMYSVPRSIQPIESIDINKVQKEFFNTTELIN
ncbi:hypothetical protein Syn7502_03534 [Synechococcus sp. PCC 7502]|uniref:hypothetical protein n=1 Tax=Synechococcus sp. PCC 7502 TaxID=1173263 RepID=UPI00029FD886|nr:hypothetical protein [Synechococcus sp. PCC 7502]AFY75372.1 hypothetical protein Syn7502_03534 [Synechococcus sp. PCC 7502]